MEAYYIGLVGALIIAIIALLFTWFDEHSSRQHKS